MILMMLTTMMFKVYIFNLLLLIHFNPLCCLELSELNNIFSFCGILIGKTCTLIVPHCLQRVCVKLYVRLVWRAAPCSREHEVATENRNSYSVSICPVFPLTLLEVVRD
jgi:hypothetical protein